MSNNLTHQIQNLPLEIYQKWEAVLKELDSKGYMYKLCELGLGDFLREMNNGQFYLVIRTLVKWNYGLEYLAKEEWFGKKYKIQGKRIEINAYKPFGQLLCQIFALNERCQAFEEETSYPNAAIRFRAYIQECKASEIRAIQNRPIIDAASCKLTEPIGKVKLERLARPRIEKLANFENPYNPKNSQQCHRYQLVEAALRLARESPAFRKKYWQPYIHHERTWLRHRRREAFFQDHWIEKTSDGKLCTCIQNGKGRNVIKYPFT